MENSQPLESSTATRPYDQFIALGWRISRRTALLTLAALAAGSGLYFGWSWLVAAGLAPIIVPLALCAAMCALGLWAHRTGKKDE